MRCCPPSWPTPAPGASSSLRSGRSATVVMPVLLPPPPPPLTGRKSPENAEICGLTVALIRAECLRNCLADPRFFVYIGVGSGRWPETAASGEDQPTEHAIAA